MTATATARRRGAQRLLRLIVTPAPPSRVRTGYHRPRTTTLPAPGSSWRHRGNCRHEDPDAFFDCHKAEIRAVKAICGHCPVRRRCLADALTRNERWGIWGGLTTQERDKIRRAS